MLPAQGGRQTPKLSLPARSGMCWTGRGEAAQPAPRVVKGGFLEEGTRELGLDSGVGVSKAKRYSWPGGTGTRGRGWKDTHTVWCYQSRARREAGSVTGPGLCGLRWPTGSHWRCAALLGRCALPVVLLDPSAACHGGCPHFADEKTEARGTKLLARASQLGST